MNLDLLYQATDLTKDPKYTRIADRQAVKSMNTHVRPDGTTCHVVNMDQHTGEALELMTHQGKYPSVILSPFQKKSTSTNLEDAG